LLFVLIEQPARSWHLQLVGTLRPFSWKAADRLAFADVQRDIVVM
jgi:hypothetical protein